MKNKNPKKEVIEQFIDVKDNPNIKNSNAPDRIQILLFKAKCPHCGKYLVWRQHNAGWWQYVPLSHTDESSWDGRDDGTSVSPELFADCHCKNAFGNLTETEIEELADWLEVNYEF